MLLLYWFGRSHIIILFRYQKNKVNYKTKYSENNLEKQSNNIILGKLFCPNN